MSAHYHHTAYCLTLYVYPFFRNPGFSLTSFEIGRKLGRGKFGRVYLARTRAPPHFVCAIKCLMKDEIKKDKVEKQVRREIEIQQNLR